MVVSFRALRERLEQVPSSLERLANYSVAKKGLFSYARMNPLATGDLG